MLGVLLKRVWRRLAFTAASRRQISTTQDLEDGFARLLADDHAGAKRIAGRILGQVPEHAAACVLMAQAHGAEGELGAALAWTERALRADANYPDAHFVRGLVLEQQADAAGAIEAYARVLCLAPAHVEAMDRKGALHDVRGEFGESLDCARSLIRIDPANSSAHLKLAITMRELGRLVEAEEALRKAALMAPQDQDVLCRLALVLIDQGKFGEAEPLLLQLLAVEPGHQEAQWTTALLYLLQARFELGWRFYEARETRRETHQRFAAFPEWQGQAVTQGSLLIHAEQGLGDEIMFASCFNDVMLRAPSCVLECDRRLVNLFRRSFPGAEVRATGKAESPHRHDAVSAPIVAQLPSGSLPGYFRRTAADFPPQAGYLLPDPATVRAWRARLGALGPGLTVGLAWTGGTIKTRQRLRSVRADDLLPLLCLDRCHFVSLQYVDSRDEIAQLEAQRGATIHAWPEILADYDETAALVGALDLVVSVCTALVHLAGAIGTPVWVMVPAAPEWRYLREGTTMPWYPNARLCRQQRLGEWEGVIAQIAHELAAQRPKFA